MDTTSTTPSTTAAPADAEWADHSRWAIQPVGTRRQMWVRREAQAIFTRRTGNASPPPALADYAEADRRVPQAAR
jgi:hypothetical protein